MVLFSQTKICLLLSMRLLKNCSPFDLIASGKQGHSECEVLGDLLD